MIRQIGYFSVSGVRFAFDDGGLRTGNRVYFDKSRNEVEDYRVDARPSVVYIQWRLVFHTIIFI